MQPSVPVTPSEREPKYCLQPKPNWNPLAWTKRPVTDANSRMRAQFHHIGIVDTKRQYLQHSGPKRFNGSAKMISNSNSTLRIFYYFRVKIIFWKVLFHWIMINTVSGHKNTALNFSLTLPRNKNRILKLFSESSNFLLINGRFEYFSTDSNWANLVLKEGLIKILQMIIFLGMRIRSTNSQKLVTTCWFWTSI